MASRVQKLSMRWSWAVLALVGLCAPGCASQALRGPGFRDQYADFGATLRPLGDGADRFGFSEKARQIERNVGY